MEIYENGQLIDYKNVVLYDPFPTPPPKPKEENEEENRDDSIKL